MTNKFSLFIGDLDISTNESQISDHFNKLLAREGSVQSVKVVREHTAPYNSRKYGYINFTTHADAETALEKFNYGSIGGKQYRLSWCDPDPSTRKTQKGNVCVKGLPSDITSKRLHELFVTVGPILSCRISEYGTKKSGHHGYVQYKDHQHAQAAIEKFNGQEEGGSKLIVEAAKPFAEQIVHNSIYVGGFSPEVAPDVIEGQIKEVFENVVKVVIITTKDANRVSRGFGFVFFDNEAEARKAVETYNGKQVEKLNNAVIKVQIAYTKWERLQYRKKLQSETRFRNMYVRGFPSDYDDEKLRDLFKSYGNVTSYKIMRNENKISKGFGFVCFEKQEDARRSLELSGKSVDGETSGVLVVNYYQTKEERTLIHRKRYEEQINQQQQQQYHQTYSYSQQAYGGAFQGRGNYPQGQGIAGQNYQQVAGHPNYQLTTQQLNQRARPNVAAYPPNYNQTRPAQPGPQAQRQVPQSGYNIPPQQGYGYNLPQQQQQQQQRMIQQQYPPYLYPIAPTGAQVGGQVGQISPAFNAISQNVQMPQPTTTGSVASLPVSENTKSGTVDTEKLAKMGPEEQKQYLGELIYPGVMAVDEPNAGKITGMLLELETQELIHLLDDNKELNNKIIEAQNVLREASQHQ